MNWGSSRKSVSLNSGLAWSYFCPLYELFWPHFWLLYELELCMAWARIQPDGWAVYFCLVVELISVLWVNYWEVWCAIYIVLSGMWDTILSRMWAIGLSGINSKVLCARVLSGRWAAVDFCMLAELQMCMASELQLCLVYKLEFCLGYKLEFCLVYML